MGNLEKLEKLQKLKDSGSLTEEEFNQEKEKLLKENKKTNKKVLIIMLIIVILIVVGLAIYCLYYASAKADENTTNESNVLDTSEAETSENIFEEASANVYANGTNSVSFENMSEDDEDLTDTQKEIVSYFDTNYFTTLDTESFQRYPQVFEDAKVHLYFGVKKVLESTDSEFEALVYAEGSLYDDIYENVDIGDIPTNVLFVIKGSQMEERLLENDHAEVYGRYVDVEEYVIDGVTYNLATVNIINITQGTRYDINTITTVAKSIFGDDIKVTTLGDDEYLEMDTYLSSGMQSSGYRVTLDNQSNSNFKSFVMDTDAGWICYDWKNNDLSDNVTKKLFVAADFQHYIVSTYDAGLQHVYIEYFDNQYNKLWSREFDYNSTKAYSSPMDYTSTQMACVIDNDLYLIDLETGENIIEPVTVGEKRVVIMVDDGIILINDDNKDTVMKVGYDGETIFKINGELKLETISYIDTQIVNGKLIVNFYGTTSEGYYRDQYLVVTNDGTLELSTNV